MFAKILVPLDGSELAEGIYPYLRDVAPRFDSEVNLIGVSIWAEPKLSRGFEAYLEKEAASFVKQKIDAKAIHAHGNPAEELLKFAEENKVDLIAMTTHGHSGFTRWLVGSTAEKIIQGAKSPILLVRGKESVKPPEGEHAFSRILVPLDGSKLGEAALPSVELLARKTGGFVTLLYVEPGSHRRAGVREFKAESTEKTGMDPKKEAKEYLARVERRLKRRTVKVDSKILSGNPAEKIIDYARDQGYDLIAMSTRGRSGVARWVLGSVVDKVIRGSDVPVFVAGPGQTKITA
jgi:nucleotide-binding universal stress UspA family protein